MTKNNHEITELSLQGFLKHIMRIDDEDTEQRFCFIIGAGASASSDIPMTKNLADQLLIRLYEDDHHEKVVVSMDELKRWATKKNLEKFGVKNFNYSCRESFYQDLFKTCFMNKMNIGKIFIEELIQGKQPNIGYLALAKILSMNKHNIVITTNFDNLVADALTLFSNTYARVVGHEHLASFAIATKRRPLIAKIHRDWLFDPNNDDVHTLPEKWVKPLTDILNTYTPIVLGYAGNDGGLMGFMEKFEFRKDPNYPNKHNIYWCYRYSGEKPTKRDLPNERILNLIKHYNGILVPHKDFDKTMLELFMALNYKIHDDLGISKPSPGNNKSFAIRAFVREEKLLKKLRELYPDDPPPGPGGAGGGGSVEPSPKYALSLINQDWRDWELKARKEPDIEKKKLIYEEGIILFPHSCELIGNFAHLLKAHEEYDRAEYQYRNALRINPNDSINTGNLAFFLDTVRNNIEEAEKLYKKSIRLDPNRSENTTRFAFFLFNQKRYRQALEKTKHVLNNLHCNRWSARSAFCSSLAFNKLFENENPALGRLKTLLENGFERGDSLFYGILEISFLKTPEWKHDFYKALALSIEEQSKLNELNAFQEWKEIKPIDLGDSWEE